MKGRSTTRTATVSLVVRPSVAYSTRSASNGPSTSTALSPASASALVRHELPVTRSATVTRRRPGARTVSVTFSPRSTERGASLIVTPPSSVPFQALTGCSNARHPSGAADAAETSATIPNAAKPSPAIARRPTSRRSAGASVGSPSPVRRPATCSAFSRPSTPTSATSSAPRTEPARNRRSSSTARAMRATDVSRANRPRSQRPPATAAATASPHPRKGVTRGSDSHRLSPSAIVATSRTSATPASTSALPPAVSCRAMPRRSRSTRSMRVMRRAGGWSRRRRRG